MPLNELTPEWKDRRTEACEDAQVNTTRKQVMQKLEELGYNTSQYVDLVLDMYNAKEVRNKVFSIIATEELNEELVK